MGSFEGDGTKPSQIGIMGPFENPKLDNTEYVSEGSNGDPLTKSGAYLLKLILGLCQLMNID